MVQAAFCARDASHAPISKLTGSAIDHSAIRQWDCVAGNWAKNT